MRCCQNQESQTLNIKDLHLIKPTNTYVMYGLKHVLNGIGKTIKPYGFRVAEPQHDGTPHWHILLFVEKHQVVRVKSVISHYSLLEDGDERGAKENRCDFKLIDPNKGSATGYIAKYVSKNIDGEGLEKGVYGEDPITAAQRVDAWSSCWCIRQFQQIGGASVSVWRELRRLKQKLIGDAFPKVVEQARQAADESNWHEYINAMGGVFIKQKEQPLKLAYDVSANTQTGECKLGQYDGDIIQSIKGLLYKGQVIVTRFFSWRLERTNQFVLTWSSVNNCTSCIERSQKSE